LVNLCLLFDLDATLVLTGGAGLRGLHRALKDIFQVDAQIESISPAGKTDSGILIEVCRLFLKRDPRPDEETRFFEKYYTYLDEEIAGSDNFQVLPGIKTLLETLSRDERCFLGLGTGNMKRGAETKLRHPGLWDLFKFGGFGSDSSVRSKLLKLAIERGAGLLKKGERFDEIWVIGDTPKDISAGKLVNAKTAGVATGPYSFDQLKECEPDLVYNDLSDYKMFMADIGL